MNKPQILDGKKVSQLVLDEIAARITQRVDAGLQAPGLAVVLVGNDEASHVYVKNKIKACEKTGIRSITHNLPRQTSAKALYALIDELNQDDDIDGILVQLPLPEHINETEVTNRIHPDKDVDGFHASNVGHLALRQPGLRPCTPRGVMTLLHHYDLDPKGMHCVIVGASNIVGRPLMLEMLFAGATVTICHRFTKDLAHHVAQADVLCVAVGNPNIVDASWIKKGAVVIDIGINRKAEGGLCGDVDFAVASKLASYISPVPGGIGPMTVATLMQNTFEASL
ncbi:bifunctional methylenetetrahydrofolate dehydrogenase/methenyltetrahydrofolate cyclohydrolase FolD [Marinicella sp. S1101]|uniref:bifunctional methylenetetrahydrofolate dehydrogenase/methenyltetrahydrofolate cyclohydrolase FolD n=1 Tax=Marinicella marina TaxID=2996016 RepID=UPI002260C996|nr:bifunctional methylenetetrahydrofolate dehydrogenase/methenyltetrahydrofolate cyclohydrolase FolD [Marinicella marina]MCX7553617.1 bifunctional methylenetetrahydrofolate dehydrogenase/methenyltetrahydrofolate cyclohydrolase FolD [Marinicella marina]MDJ1140241.1 bifunctional methylenetetrahydrofolate dehydrogenase/methenyltetrahydrofolate cyclohydrolase FolD [Marinicella marina]